MDSPGAAAGGIVANRGSSDSNDTNSPSTHRQSTDCSTTQSHEQANRHSPKGKQPEGHSTNGKYPNGSASKCKDTDRHIPHSDDALGDALAPGHWINPTRAMNERPAEYSCLSLLLISEAAQHIRRQLADDGFHFGL